VTTKSNHANPQHTECVECGGTGREPGRHWYECDTCHGRGQVYVPGVGQDAEDDPICPACRGSGYVDNGDSQPHPCGRCITEGRL
jgi:DnaJ-class molecular chaperone